MNLSHSSLQAFLPDVAARAEEKGLRYLTSAGPVPIAVAYPPVLLTSSAVASLSNVASLITRALFQTAKCVLGGDLGQNLASSLLDELAPLERDIVSRTYDQLEQLAAVRVDMMLGTDDRYRVLEVNTTIPAMQGYSDMVTSAFIEGLLLQRTNVTETTARTVADALVSEHGSNTIDLWRSLCAGHHHITHLSATAGGIGSMPSQPRTSPTDVHPSIALIHRDHDAQLYELRYIREVFERLGSTAHLVLAPDLHLSSNGRASTDTGFEPDILYRHIFANRVDPSWPLAEIMRAPRQHVLLNPVCPHLEQKSMLAELSAACADEHRAELFGLDKDHVKTILSILPWTRRLTAGPATDQQGRAITSLFRHVSENADSLVLKRSWDFGGRAVFIGRTYGDSYSIDASTRLFGRFLSWTELVDHCIQQGGWVVQEMIPVKGSRGWVATPNGVTEHELFTDMSIFTNLNEARLTFGPVCRFSSSRIVNLQQGGGLVPVLTNELLEGIRHTSNRASHDMRAGR